MLFVLVVTRLHAIRSFENNAPFREFFTLLSVSRFLEQHYTLSDGKQNDNINTPSSLSKAAQSG